MSRKRKSEVKHTNFKTLTAAELHERARLERRAGKPDAVWLATLNAAVKAEKKARNA